VMQAPRMLQSDMNELMKVPKKVLRFSYLIRSTNCIENVGIFLMHVIGSSTVKIISILQP
jgi:hypothetical protein